MPELPKIELLKEDDESEILNALSDFLDNGGKVPADIKMVQRLTLAAVREIYHKACSNANATRNLQVALGIVSFIVLILATAFVALHPSELLMVFRP
jgi:hypothetical protein